MTISRNLAYGLAAIALLTGLPGAAAAKQKSVYVEYGDLDLGRAKDQRTLDRRIDRAILRLCGTTDMARNMAEIQRVEACIAEARDDLATQRARAEAQAQQRLASAAPADERN